MGDFFGYKEDSNNRRMLVSLDHSSHICQVANKFHFIVCWVAPIETAVGLDVAEWRKSDGCWVCGWRKASDLCGRACFRYPNKFEVIGLAGLFNKLVMNFEPDLQWRFASRRGWFNVKLFRCSWRRWGEWLVKISFTFQRTLWEFVTLNICLVI